MILSIWMLVAFKCMAADSADESCADCANHYARSGQQLLQSKREFTPRTDDAVASAAITADAVSDVAGKLPNAWLGRWFQHAWAGLCGNVTSRTGRFTSRAQCQSFCLDDQDCTGYAWEDTCQGHRCLKCRRYSKPLSEVTTNVNAAETEHGGLHDSWNCYRNMQACIADVDCSGHGTTTDVDATDGCDCICDAGYVNGASLCDTLSCTKFASEADCAAVCEWTNLGACVERSCADALDCSGHGTASDDDGKASNGCTCTCELGYKGADCSHRTYTMLTVGHECPSGTAVNDAEECLEAAKSMLEIPWLRSRDSISSITSAALPQGCMTVPLHRFLKWNTATPGQTREHVASICKAKHGRCSKHSDCPSLRCIRGYHPLTGLCGPCVDDKVPSQLAINTCQRQKDENGCPSWLTSQGYCRKTCGACRVVEDVGDAEDANVEATTAGRCTQWCSKTAATSHNLSSLSSIVTTFAQWNNLCRKTNCAGCAPCSNIGECVKACKKCRKRGKQCKKCKGTCVQGLPDPV